MSVIFLKLNNPVKDIQIVFSFFQETSFKRIGLHGCHANNPQCQRERETKTCKLQFLLQKLYNNNINWKIQT